MTSFRKNESPWTPPIVNRLVQLWNEGRLNKNGIADELHMTREAVVGKIYRERRKGVKFRKRFGGDTPGHEYGVMWAESR